VRFASATYQKTAILQSVNHAWWHYAFISSALQLSAACIAAAFSSVGTIRY
jgi:hypothetical protein